MELGGILVLSIVLFYCLLFALLFYLQYNKIKTRNLNLLIDNKPDKIEKKLVLKSTVTKGKNKPISIPDEFIERNYPGKTPPIIHKNYNSKSIPVGLKNLGNTCYMNSALQCLFHSFELTEHLLNEKCSGRFTEKYTNLIRKLCNSQKSSIKPREFKSALTELSHDFEGYNQNDSVKVVSCVIDKLNEELNQIKEKSYKLIIEQQQNETDEAASKRYWDYHLARNKSIIVDQFYGQYKSTVICIECKKNVITFEPFSNILLPIPKLIKVNMFIKNNTNNGWDQHRLSIDENLLFFNLKENIKSNYKSEINDHKFFVINDKSNHEVKDTEKLSDYIKNNKDLIICFSDKFENINSSFKKESTSINKRLNLLDCFEYLTSWETLEGWYCKNCKRNLMALKKIQVFRFPKLLIIYLRRFNLQISNRDQPVKIDAYVEFPINNLDLSKFSQETNKKLLGYDLYAVSRHFGTINSGHFTALAKRDQEWFEFNDSYVTKIDESNIQSSGTYLLFYRMKS